jgi:hypothetical protein
MRSRAIEPLGSPPPEPPSNPGTKKGPALNPLTGRPYPAGTSPLLQSGRPNEAG